MMGQSKIAVSRRDTGCHQAWPEKGDQGGQRDGKVVFQGQRWKFCLGAPGNPLGWGLGFQPADEPIFHFMVQSLRPYFTLVFFCADGTPGPSDHFGLLSQ